MDLHRIWLTLLALTAATTALSFGSGAVVAAGLVALAFLKARAIMSGFLHLDRAPEWRTAFTLPLALWLVLIWGLFAL
ncbi:cytochrome C oxidase subunit IV family protein [Paracoccus kondratievae]|uniref:Nitric oxide reductase F protein n=1 Tax=Paracoccus kondratievae TaxID=135740 RepID=A0AAD3RSL2_9RHOB|nr:cytochrome C oxidase subunit IV family protein [Paracoccus kondratievae]GLK62714.1 hypothetical protein GCM10017635_01820 [Paracoccus kondratievae]